MSKKIYLSPANHTKPYITGQNEKQQMELVAKQVQSILSDYDCDVYYPTVFNNAGISGDYQGRPQEAKTLNSSIYVSIHSNAAGTANSTATGCCVFYHESSAEGKRLATAFQEKLDSVCPIKSNRAVSMKVINGMSWNGSSLGEIREPYRLGMTSVLIETNFHDYKPTAEWIVGNISVIAQAIADVLISFYDIKKKSPAATVTPETSTSTISIGDTVKVNPGAVYGGLSSSRGKAVASFVYNNTYTVTKIQTNSSVVEALLDGYSGGFNSWIAVSSLTVVSDDKAILEKIVYAEAGGEDEKGQILVANVIMNRVKNKSFPNSVYDVVMQKNQFAPVASGTYAKAVPTAKVKASVDKALSGVDYSQGALYFRTVKGATADCWHETALTALFDHGGHRFYI